MGVRQQQAVKVMFNWEGIIVIVKTNTDMALTLYQHRSKGFTCINLVNPQDIPMKEGYYLPVITC